MQTEVGQREGDGRRDEPPADSAQGEGGFYQGIFSCTGFLCLVLSPVQLILTVHLTHQELMQGQEEATQPSSVETEEEMRAVKEELQLALKKEREAQVFANHQITGKYRMLVFFKVLYVLCFCALPAE